jgi:hypothetical protein
MTSILAVIEKFPVVMQPDINNVCNDDINQAIDLLNMYNYLRESFKDYLQGYKTSSRSYREFYFNLTLLYSNECMHTTRMYTEEIKNQKSVTKG